jgi:hypothetical protein
VGLAVVEPALDGGADAGGNRRIADVEVERHVDAGGAASGDRQRLLHDRRDPLAIDVLHREYVHARVPHLLLLHVVQVADTDEHGLLRDDFGREVADAGQFRRLRPQQRGQRHPVHVAARRRRGGVHVAVGVHPEQAERLVLSPGEFGGRADRTRREAVIPAEHERDPPFLERAQRRFVQLLADARDLADVALVRVARGFHLRNRRGDVPPFHDGVAERLQFLVQAGDAQRGGPHVHPAPVPAEIERHPDDVNRLDRGHWRL